MRVFPISATRRLVRFVAVSLVAAPICALSAQGTIRGKVVEVGTERPIADVQVRVTGTTSGAVTNSQGDFVIAAVPAGQREVVARRLGYTKRSQNVTVSAGGDVRANFTMTPAASELEAIVVSGTAGTAEKRQIGNAVTQIDASSVTAKTSLTTVSDLLQARAPGLVVGSGAGTPGAAAEITIRGYGSLTTNRPVVFVDGVRIDTDNISNFGASGSGTAQLSGQTTSALDMINPQDIESIEVLKGPAAATLYGADAASGVIQIITKKGKRGQQPLRWAGRAESGWNEWGVKPLTNYSMCTPARKAAVDAAGVPTWSRCQGQADSAVISDQPFVRDANAMRDGKVQNLSTSLNGGGDLYSFYVSFDKIHNEGILFNSNDDRRSLRTNFTFNPIPVLDFNINLSYIKSLLRLPLGDEAANGLLLSGARGIPGLTPPSTDTARFGWGTINAVNANKYNNQTETDRLIVSTTGNYNPLSWLHNRFTAGVDFRSSLAEVLSLPNDPDTPTGLNAQRAPRIWNYTLDYAGSAVFDLRSNLNSITSFGTQITSNQTEVLGATGTGLPTAEVTTIGSALTLSGSSSFSEQNSVGIYGQQQFGWNNRLFVTGAIRMDDNSSFGTNFDAIVYPKLSASYVMSEEPRFRGMLDKLHVDNLRLRGAWGEAGRAPAPFSAAQTYTSSRTATSATGVVGGLRTSGIGNPDLKPEMGTEYELGFESDFYRGRFGIDFTYYRKEMKDLLVGIALPPSAGFGGTQLQNLGSTLNKGIELSLNAIPIDRRHFQWETRFNIAHNDNKLLSLDTIRTCQPWFGETCQPGKSLAEDIPGGASYTPGLQRNRPGFPLGSYFVRYPKKDANGNYVFTGTAPNLVPVYDTTFQYVGPAWPPTTMSWSNSFRVLDGIQFYALFDAQRGHYQINYKEYNRCALVANGPNCERLAKPGVSPEERALYGSTGTPTTVTLPMTQTLYLEKADFVKLRDVSVSFDVPRSLISRTKMERANLVLSGHNLKMWTKYTGLDPEVNGYGSNVIRGSGSSSQFVRADAYSMPMTRRYSLQLNVTY
ncbi:MAG TPA: SusC/RagA family TonB-linked outer membrane protein [Gemmatimonadaceae bacterium]|jgi:TonB-linked SusC/RagA family outer membrane protein|nr:SusC/RagA family TonB-linked outer membrane protein [Gemmatimonadaceae bacterium]